MTIQSVFDPSFSKYGQVLTGYDLTGLLDTLERVTPVPEGTEYVPEQPELMALPVCGELSDRAYGGMPIQIGWCNGHNTKLNCLEYHRDSELNVGVQDFILLVAKREDMALLFGASVRTVYRIQEELREEGLISIDKKKITVNAEQLGKLEELQFSED